MARSRNTRAPPPAPPLHSPARGAYPLWQLGKPRRAPPSHGELLTLAAAGANATTTGSRARSRLVPNAAPRQFPRPAAGADHRRRPKTAAPSLPFNPLVGMGTAVDPLASPLRLPKELDEKVTDVAEFLAGSVGGCGDIPRSSAALPLFATELIERQAARMWGTWQAATHDQVLMNEALAYTGYDVYVEGLDFGLDTYLASLNVAQRAQRAPTMAVTSAQHLSVQWATSGAMLQVRGPVGALHSYKLRGAYALLESSQEGKTSRSTSTACRSSGPASTSPARRQPGGDGRVALPRRWLRRHKRLRALPPAVPPRGIGRQAARRGVGALPRLHPAARRALRRDPARVAVRGAPEVEVGIPAYWASRRALLSVDNLHRNHRRFAHDTASAVVPGALGACADLGMEETLGNAFGDDYKILVSESLGIHCALTHDQLWPHKARLLQLAYEHINSHADGSSRLDGSSRHDEKVDPRDVDPAKVPEQQLVAAVVELAREVSEATAHAPLGSGAPMLGYSCGMREINNLNARYSFLHLGRGAAVPRRREGPPVGRGAERRGGVSRPRARGRGREPLSVEHLHHPPRHALPAAGGGGGGGVGPDGEAVAGVPPSLPGAHLRQHGEQGGAGDRPRRRRRRRRLHQPAHRALLDPRRGQQDGGRGQPPHLLAVRQAQHAGVRLAARPRRRRLRAARRRHHAAARRRLRVLHAVHVHLHEEPARARLPATHPAPRRRRPPRRAPQVQPQREAAHVRDAHGMPRQRLRGDPRRCPLPIPPPPAPLALASLASHRPRSAQPPPTLLPQ